MLGQKQKILPNDAAKEDVVEKIKNENDYKKRVQTRGKNIRFRRVSENLFVFFFALSLSLFFISSLIILSGGALKIRDNVDENGFWLFLNKR